VFVLLFMLLAAAPLVAQEATSEALPLTETFGSDDTFLSFQYPDGWTAAPLLSFNAFGPLAYLTNDTAFIENNLGHPEPRLTEGMVYMQLAVVPREGLAFGQDEADTAWMLERFLSAWPLLPDAEMEAISPVQIGEREGAQVTITGETWARLDTAIQFGNGWFVVLSTYALPDELDEWAATAESVLSSVNYDMRGNTLSQPPAPDVEPAPALPLTETYTAAHAGVELRYPSDWVYAESTNAILFTTFVNGDPAQLSFSSFEVVPPSLPTGTASILVNNIAPVIPNALVPTQSADQWFAYLEGAGAAVERTTLGEWPAVINRQRAVNGESSYIVLEVGDAQFINFTLFAAPGELGLWEPTLLAMAESITVE
jgi:hypothetical protein